MTARGRADDQIHVVPEQGSDDVMHTLDEDCICGPAVERVETGHGDEWLCVHHSLDGRETREPVLTGRGRTVHDKWGNRVSPAPLLGEPGSRPRLVPAPAAPHTARCRSTNRREGGHEMTTTTSSTVAKIRAAFAAVVEDIGLPEDFINETATADWTRVSLDLPDGTVLAAYDDDIDVVVLLNGSAEISRLRLSNVSTDLLVGVLSAIVSEALKD